MVCSLMRRERGVPPRSEFIGGDVCRQKAGCLGESFSSRSPLSGRVCRTSGRSRSFSSLLFSANLLLQRLICSMYPAESLKFLIMKRLYADAHPVDASERRFSVFDAFTVPGSPRPISRFRGKVEVPAQTAKEHFETVFGSSVGVPLRYRWSSIPLRRLF